MPTQHLYRVHIVVQTLTVSSFNTWIRNNIDPGGGNWITPSLSSTGTGLPTAGQCSAALTSPQLRLLIVRLCELSGVTFPSQWDVWTRTERKEWIASQRNTIDLATGIYITVSDNDGTWDKPRQALLSKGLTAILGASVVRVDALKI